MRAANPVDFWRGVALVMIFINHVPGNLFSYFTLRNYAISDAAELFVFLAGWSMSYATGKPGAPDPAGQVTFRLIFRAVQIYRAQLVITMLALAMLSGAAMYSGNPLFLEWLNAGLAFYDPVSGLIGLVLLTYQLGYFNILPLYVVLLLPAPLFVLIARRSRLLALALSLGVYGWALVTGVSFPSWPSEERWYFNPLSWQILLAVGFLAAEVARESEAFRRAARRAVPLAVVILIAGAFVTIFKYWPDPARVPEPKLLFLFDKTYLSPARLISLAALIITFHGIYPHIERFIGPVARWMCRLGRNSLAVFSVGSLLALAGQMIRFVTGGGIFADIFIVSSGVILLGLTACFVEWRSRGSG